MNLFYIKYCFLTILFTNYSHGCTPTTSYNVESADDALISYILEPVKDFIPVFNSSTVPKMDNFYEEFQAGSKNEDIHLNITQLLTKYGYGSEEHQVKTKDGYVLDIFRIPSNGSVVFVMHGILSSSDDFLSIGPDRALAYYLADLGYDVWLGNARGNVHGRKNVYLSPECAEFWNFSWDEIGRYDLTAMIDYVLETTNQKQLAFIGHSQGCTTFFVMASELPDYNNKISVMIALSGVSFLKHSTDPIFNVLAPFSNPVYALAKTIGLYELVPRNQITNAITSIACGSPITAALFCNNILFILYGFDYAQVNATLLPVIYGHFPGGSATKQFIHYGQEIISGKFSQFDYGSIENLKKYGTVRPPDYPLGKITSKVAIFYADNDYLFTAPDREHLIQQLPNVIDTYRVPFKAFTHADFIFANDVRKLVYDKVIEILKINAIT